MILMKKISSQLNKHYLPILSRFISSYSLMLFIPMILMGWLTYSQYYRVLNQKVGDSVTNMLVQVRDIMDVCLNELIEMPVQVQRGSDLNSVLAAQDLSRFNSYQIYKAIRELNSCKPLSDFVDEIIIYIRNEDKVITTKTISDTELFFNNIYRYEGLSSKEFLQRISPIKEVTIFPSSPVRIGTDLHTQSFITYVRPLFINDVSDGSNLKAIITIKENAVRKLMDKVLSGYHGVIYILDKDMNIIMVTGKEPSPEYNQYITSLTAKNGEGRPSFVTRLGDEKVLVSSTTSTKLGFSYISIIPTQQVFSEVNHIWNLSVWAVLIVLLVGILFALFFTYRNYSPLRKLLHILFEGDRSFLRTRHRNEWDAIGKQILQTMDSKKELEQRMRKQYPILRESFLRKLLMGNSMDERSANSISEFLEIDTSSGLFSVMVFFINACPASNPSGSATEADLHRFIVCNVVEELCSSFGRGYSVQIDDRKVAILLHFQPDAAQNASIRLKEIAQAANRFFKEHYHFTVSVGIGRTCEDLLIVRNSYHEASFALEYRIIRGNDSILDFDDIKVTHQFVNYYTLEDEKSVIDYLKRGEMDGIVQILDAVVQKLNDSFPSPETIHCVFFEIISTAIQVVDKTGITSFNTLPVTECLQNLLQCTTIDDLYDEILQFYSLVCTYLTDRKECKNSQLANRLILYIDKNYSNKELCLTSVAEAFDITPSYVSRFFKDYFGRNFNEYLQGKRMDMARELLRNSGKTINEIADVVGYSSPHSFINNFKKVEGITPGLYRDKGLV